MPSEILAKTKTAVTPAISLASRANNAGQISDLIDNTTTKAARGYVALDVTVGATVTNGAVIKLYLIRQTTGTVKKSGGGGLGDVDATVSAEPVNAVLVGSIVVSSTANANYEELFPVYDPGPKFSFLVWNTAGGSLNSSQPSPALVWLPEVDEAQ
jgi:hypothetical protein